MADQTDHADEQDCDRDCSPDTHVTHCQYCDACAPLCQRLGDDY